MSRKESQILAIDQLARENKNFRKVVSTPGYLQVVIMTLKPGEEIGLETHSKTDQILFIVEGYASVFLDGITQKVRKGNMVIVQHGTKHNITNASKTKSLKLISMYSPPEHNAHLVQRLNPTFFQKKK